MQMRGLSRLNRGRGYLRAVATLAAALTVGACSDSTAPEATPIVVSGTLAGPSLASLPSGSRVVIVWIVTSGSPDYAYVYGAGTIAAANGRFTVTLPDRPPAAALNTGGIGVGLIVAVAPGTSIPTGRVTSDAALTAAAVGGAGNYAVIYKSSESGPFAWLDAFPRGYSVGRGIDLPGTFDGFTPVAPNTVELIVDDISEIDFVNWT